jgi:hypothetical protein
MEKAVKIQKIEDAMKIVSDSHHWTKGTVARDSRGNQCAIYDPAAVRFCAIGALYLSSRRRGAGESAAKNIQHMIEAQNRCRLVYLNDRVGRQAVIKVFEKTLETLRVQSTPRHRPLVAAP